MYCTVYLTLHRLYLTYNRKQTIKRTDLKSLILLTKIYTHKLYPTNHLTVSIPGDSSQYKLSKNCTALSCLLCHDEFPRQRILATQIFQSHISQGHLVDQPIIQIPFYLDKKDVIMETNETTSGLD